MHNHSIVISDNAPKSSICEICGEPAIWQMYCMDCGNIIRFYCYEHAFLSQGNENLEKRLKKALLKNQTLKTDKQIKKAYQDWQEYLKL